MDRQKVISFGRGVPATEAINRVKNEWYRIQPEIQEMYGNSGFEYKSAFGDFGGAFGLRESIAERFEVSGDPKQRVICSNGGMEMIAHVINSLPPGPVLVEEATYNRVLEHLGHINRQAIGVKLGEDGIDPRQLEETINTYSPVALYRIPFHQNPTGICASEGNLYYVGAVCARYNIVDIADIAYIDLRYDSALNFLPDTSAINLRNTIFIGSFSKTLSPGAKCGFGIIPESFTKRIQSVVDNARLNPSYITQFTYDQIMRNGFFDEQLLFLWELYAPRMNALDSSIRDHLFLNVTPTTGGFFRFLALSNISDGNALVQAAKANNLIIEPGIDCVPLNFRSQYNGRFPIRLTFPALTPEEIVEGTRRLACAYEGVIDLPV
ncbi:MAG: PLP-dependent aminotransferase family protein [Patescibacteria group bacterium]|jgi:2-aminoadipate transaminase